jgi:hypothetical protein
VQKLWTTRAKLVEKLRTQNFFSRDVSVITSAPTVDVAFA